jgi:serine/threonine-protein kinase HSL1 (negative regulator of Swe1 kinase)
LSGEPVAIKLLNDISLISTEIAIMKKLNHKNVCRVIDTFDKCVVLEYASEGDLYTHILSNRVLTEKSARHLFKQIIDGVSYCHKMGVIHRDLKPENVLLTKTRPGGEYQIKLCDFGLSSFTPKYNLLNSSVGSPNYAAPEIILGLPYYGSEIDVWSCGCLLFVMTAGRMPFDEDNHKSLYDKIRKGKYVCPPFFSAKLKDLIGAMLCVNPSKRITMKKIKRHSWMKRSSRVNFLKFCKKRKKNNRRSL